ncbi:hypothetical protein B0H19DRAFT_226419 [Mycena capillaripes]|nr:hypothetical protein B0H19DRAFT_226419 [Mycena capillaripes]
MSSRHRSSLLGDAFASRFGRRRSSVARAPKPPLAATAVPQYVIDITAPPPDEELAEEQLGEEKEEEQPLPPFSASWSALAPFALLYAPLPKYYPASSLRIFSSARQWKDRHVLLSGPDATGVIPGHLHLFKGPAPDDRELERLELNADSVVFIAEQPGLHQQERKAHAHFVRVAGKDVGSRRKDWNPADQTQRRRWGIRA